jgi:CMP-N,N'-diacetyllegionaminic acid synthase
MKIVALILARGGSKGILNKNLVDIGGKPLVAHQIINCIGCSGIDDVYVSSNSSEILNASVTYGARPIRRSENISLDMSSSEEALLEFANEVDFDILVFAQTTSPLITSSDIQLGLDKFLAGKYDSVFSITTEHWVPKWSTNITPIDWDPDNRPMRQEKDSVYSENGAFYITTKDFLQKNKNRYGGNMGVVEIPLIRSFQIDTEEDLDLIRRLI